MSHLGPAIEAILAEASNRWRWLLFLQRTAKLATLATALMFLLGVGMAVGWLTSGYLVAAGFGVVVVATVAAWMVIALMTVCAMDSDRRPWLAASIERHHKPLMDRLNTLVFLQHTRDRQLQRYVEQIETQTQEELIRQPPALPFSPRQALVHAGALGLALALTVLFFAYFRPWQHVSFVARDIDVPQDNGEALDIPPLVEGPAEKLPELPWGDVRVSEPGSDLRVTPLDVVPLRIEASANRPLKKVDWFSAVNGADEVQHPLPTPGDPSYWAYQLELPVPDFAAEPWDVVRYYARATTEDGATYESQAYFLEVIPFRDELEAYPGGPRGEEFERLEQLTSLIQRQDEIIRQTQHQLQSAGQSPTNRKKRLEQLAREEARLRQETSHLAADIASRTEQPATAGPEEHLQDAASTLERAEDLLRDDNLGEATRSERKALDDLVAARKKLREFLRQNPTAFKPPADPGAVRQSDSSEIADTKTPEDGSREMEDRQRQLQTAREFVQKTLLAERDLEKKANPRRPNDLPKLAEEQRRLNETLRKYVEENSPSFRRSQTECSGAQSAMQQTAQSLSAKSPNAQQQAGQAAAALQELDDALEEQQRWNRLADAHRLRRMLEQQISQLGQCQQNGLSPSQGQQLGEQVEDATSQLKQIVENETTREHFRQELRDALSDQSMQQMAGQCNGLGKSSDPNGQKKAAGNLAEQLRQVVSAFDASCPGGKSQRGRTDGLMAQGQNALDRGLQQLDSAARGQAGGRPLSAQDRARLVREARSNLGIGISEVYGNNERSEQVAKQVEEKLEKPANLIDLQTIRDLLSQIQPMSRERGTEDRPKEEPAKTSNVDLSRLPPAYRQAIEKYFEKLSEQ